MKRIKICLAALLAFTTVFNGCIIDDDDAVVDQSIKVGALLSLTGNWSSLGITSKAAMDIAIEDINAYMQQTGSKVRFTSKVYDTKLEADLAKEFIAEAKALGCDFVLGPQSSAEAAAVRNYADANNILVVSQGSTAGSLSIAGDNLFRFCPDDHIEGLAMAKSIHQDGIRALVTAARDDAGNKGLQISTGNAFTDLSGKVSATTPYSSGTNVDFASLLTDIRARAAQFAATYDTGEIAVYLASFDECVALFNLAAGDTLLSSVRWYGGDGTALSAALTADAVAAEFAIATKYFAPSFGLPAQASAKWQPLSAEIKDRTGLTPDAFALAAYDAMWVMAMSYAAFPTAKPEFEKLKAEFVAQAGRYYGATGTTMLNEAGDRAVGSYDYWGIARDGGSYKWTRVGSSE